MYSKILTFLLACFCGLSPLGGAEQNQHRFINIDKIAATVNNEIITLTDIDKAILFYPVFRTSEESEDYLYERVLQDLIHFKVVFLEYKDDFILTADDFEEVQTSIIKKQGSLGTLKKLLKRFGLEWPADFKEFIRERVLYEKVIKENFQMKITILFQEIETFYNQQYLPAQEKLQLAPRSIIEMAPLIEEHLRKERTEERLSSWLEEIKSSYRIKILPLKEGT